MKRNVIFLALLFAAVNVNAQGDAPDSSHIHAHGICDGSGYCIPTLAGLPRAKGFVLTQTRVLNSTISTSGEGTSFSSFVERNRITEAKLKLPVVVKPALKIVAGISYSVEEFRFEATELESEFYEGLENKPLRSLAAKAIVVKPFIGDKYLVGNLSYGLAGDFSRSAFSEQQRASAAVIYGKRSSISSVWGVGISYNYSFGRQAVYPLLAYSKKFNDHWSLEMLLPANVRIRYLLTEKDVLSGRLNVSGNTYFLDFENLSDQKLYLEKSDVFGTLSYEREIYDFVWFNMSVGTRTNITFDLSESRTFLDRTDPQLSSDLGQAVLYQFGIFLVAPRKWLE